METLLEIKFNLSALSGSGLTIALVGWSIVFLSLILAVILFNNLPRIIYYKTRKKMREKEKKVADKDILDISGDETAAIAIALQRYFDEQHDEESNVITIKTVKKRYSPWSSKIYGLREWPN